MNNQVLKISLNGLHKRFGEKIVLDDVNLDVMPGESMVIIGGSGSGKSVTLKCILGLLTPNSGSIKIDGQEMVGIAADDRKRVLNKFGMLFQGAALFDSLPVWENVAFGLLAQRLHSRDEAKEIAIEKLRRVGLSPDVAKLSPAELSGGMQKRVGLARAIAANPEIIFFDEPTTGLDPIMSDVINELIVECVKDVGATALTITHDMSSVRKIADNVSMIYHGNMIWTGPKDKIDQSGSEYIDQFINGKAEGPIKMEILKG
ncbi:MAG: ATP-binding cassette domain-containing protein [Emcibacteraceae bacterium]|uniref:ABC transporter ATP-binding protein n=1 Tax=Pseudemcibacter sp. TaxID=2943293 RepID=UPI003F69A2E2|nr:ATP-binding cassette domain-containing protein [Emcibacteraceae bacterium]MDG1727963.1 ATP-binding cassette domain-containing protein [Emcibacteraceae bacterium]